MMAKRKSIYERLALKQRVEMAKKSQAMRTLREELERTTKIQTQLSSIVDDTAIKPGVTTAIQIRSASWYSTRVHEQLTTISNRNEFLNAEVSTQEEQLATDRYRHELSVKKGIEHQRREREQREDRIAALLPARARPRP
jgi:hypothetical protein